MSEYSRLDAMLLQEQATGYWWLAYPNEEVSDESTVGGHGAFPIPNRNVDIIDRVICHLSRSDGPMVLGSADPGSCHLSYQ